MNTREKNKMSMFRAVEAIVSQHQETVDAMAPLSEAVTAFRQAIADILRQDKSYIGVTEGVIAAKNSSLDELVERALRLGNGMYAFGRKSGNEQLKSAGGITMSDLGRMREADIEQYCSRIAELIQTCAAELAPYGIPADEIQAFANAIEAYRSQVGEKEVRTAESRAARKALYSTFDKADEILNEDIDVLIELVKTNNVDFYNQYRATRGIRDLGHGRSSKTAAPAEAAKPIPGPVPAMAM